MLLVFYVTKIGGKSTDCGRTQLRWLRFANGRAVIRRANRDLTVLAKSLNPTAGRLG